MTTVDIPSDQFIGTGALLESINPATGEIIARVMVADKAAVCAAVKRAEAAQLQWHQQPLRERIRVLRRARNVMLDDMDSLAALITQEQGRPATEALLTELAPAADLITYYTARAGRMLADEHLSLHFFPHRRSTIHYHPIGVIGIIAPWNFPFVQPLSEIVCALLAGNAVIFKPSELTPLVGQALADLFYVAGLPHDVLQVVQGGGATGAALVEAGVGKICFTGSTGTAKKILAQAATTLTPVICELGGKDPLLVFDDADLDRAADAAVWGSFTNAGQVCASVERVYVHRKVAEQFTQKVTERTQRLRLGNAFNTHAIDMGPMTSDKQRDVVERHIADALARGATIVAGGKRPQSEATNTNGYFYEPTILTNVPQDAAVMQEETFGPVLPIIIFDTDDEAIRLANDSSFGLNAYIFSRNTARANQIAQRIATGSVIINDSLVSYGIPETPWGGVKQSGMGRIHWGEHGLREYCNAQHIMQERFRPLRRELWWYPYSSQRYLRLRRVLKAFFRRGE